MWAPGERHQVWMSHGDRVVELPQGFKVYGTSEGAPFAVIADEKRRIYAVQFHPEVAHTPDVAKLLANFTHEVCGCRGDWTLAAFRQQPLDATRKQVGQAGVLSGPSGGFDPCGAAVLLPVA